MDVFLPPIRAIAHPRHTPAALREPDGSPLPPAPLLFPVLFCFPNLVLLTFSLILKSLLGLGQAEEEERGFAESMSSITMTITSH